MNNRSNNFRPPWRQQTDSSDKQKQNESQLYRDIGGAIIRTQLRLTGTINMKKKQRTWRAAGERRRVLIAPRRFCSEAARFMAHLDQGGCLTHQKC